MTTTHIKPNAIRSVNLTRPVISSWPVTSSVVVPPPHNLNIAIPGADSRSLLVRLKRDVVLSMDSTLTTAKVEPSHVILALDYDEERVHCSLRIGLGRENTEADIDFIVERLVETARHLRCLSV